jgi:hypothetical protein
MWRGIGVNVRIGIFALLAAAFFAGCPDPVSPPDGTATGTHVLMVGIAGESPVRARTALPAVPVSAKYDISVTSGGSSLGSSTVPKGSGGHTSFNP